MLIEATPNGVRQRYEHEWHNNDGEDNVRGEHDVVEGAPGSQATKRRMNALDEDFVEHIRDKKDARYGEGRKHAGTVSDLVLRLDEIEASKEEERRDAVESGIEGRKVGYGHVRFFSRSSLWQVLAM